MEKCYWVSTPKITATVKVRNGIIIDTAPVWKRFKHVNFNKFIEFLEARCEGKIKWKEI